MTWGPLISSFGGVSASTPPKLVGDVDLSSTIQPTHLLCHIGNLCPRERSSRYLLEAVSGRYHLYNTERPLRSEYLVIISLHTEEHHIITYRGTPLELSLVRCCRNTTHRSTFYELSLLRGLTLLSVTVYEGWSSLPPSHSRPLVLRTCPSHFSLSLCPVQALPKACHSTTQSVVYSDGGSKTSDAFASMCNPHISIYIFISLALSQKIWRELKTVGERPYRNTISFCAQ